MLGLITGAGAADSVIGKSCTCGIITNGDVVSGVDRGVVLSPANVQPAIRLVAFVDTARLWNTIVTVPVARSTCHWNVAGLLVPYS